MSCFRQLSHTIWHYQYHVVWVPKYRYRILTGRVSETVNRCVRVFSKYQKAEVVELNVQIDWAWWVSWLPFVGMFIAHISRRRTVREFLISVLLVPSCVCILWMSAFGATDLSQIIDQGSSALSEAVLELRLFVMLEGLSLAMMTSAVGIILVAFFFIISPDSGLLVIDAITAGGKFDAPMPQRIFLAVFEGLIAIVLLFGSGLGVLQAASVTTGIPFAVVLLGMCVAIYKELASECRALSQARR